MAKLGMRFIRSFFGTVEHIAPILGGRIAFRLFCRTPDPARVSEKEKRLLARSLPFMKGARRHDLITHHGRFTAFEFTNWDARRDGPAVLVLHGWRSRTEHLRTVIEALLQRGFRVVALDLPGSGVSAGRTLNLASAVAAVRETADWLGPFDAAVGHSFGAAIALNAAAGSVRGVRPVFFRRLAMIGSPNALPDLFTAFGRHVGLGMRSQHALEARVEEIAGRPLSSFVAAHQLREMSISTLIVHAPDDKEVPFADALAMAGAGDHITLVKASGLGHRRILGDSAVAALVAGFCADGSAAHAQQTPVAA